MRAMSATSARTRSRIAAWRRSESGHETTLTPALSQGRGRTMRRIVLDTETTGLEPSEGHRVIELACLELNGRRPSGRHFHRYVNPERAVDIAASQVHGLTTEDLSDKPRFADIADEF